VATFSGLHPHDATAEVRVNVNSAAGASASPTMYRAIETFDQLGLSRELLSAVYAMKFVTPSKIQAQALPIILSPQRPNVIGQAHHGSGKTAAFSLGVLSRIDPSYAGPQVLILCPTRELTLQVCDVIRALAQYTQITVFACVPVFPPRKELVQAQIVVGTPGTIDSKIAKRELDTHRITMFVADEADQMVAQEGLGEKTLLIKKKLPSNTQVLLFSATFEDEVTLRFARALATNAVEILVKTEALSLDGINQYYIDCGNEEDKYRALTEIFSLLEIGQSIIFVHVRI
jgi:ATP-dependent RNA helicase DDX19/DBP5